MDSNAILTLAIGAAVALGAFLFARRYGGGTALAELERANRILDRRVGELDRQHVHDQEKIALLEARTSLEPMVASVVGQFEQHEQRAQRRHDQAMVVWELIAARLGADPETNGVSGG